MSSVPSAGGAMTDPKPDRLLTRVRGGGLPVLYTMDRTPMTFRATAKFILALATITTSLSSVAAANPVRYCNRPDLGVAAFRMVFGSTMNDRYGPVGQTSSDVAMCEGRFGLEPCDCVMPPPIKTEVDYDRGGGGGNDHPGFSDRNDTPSTDTPSSPGDTGTDSPSTDGPSTDGPSGGDTDTGGGDTDTGGGDSDPSTWS